MKVSVFRTACISCGACVVLCPRSAIRLESGCAVIDEKRCTQCRKCIYKCYAQAIRLEADDS